MTENAITLLPNVVPFGYLDFSDQRVIGKQPMVRKASVEFAREHGGPIMQEFLKFVPWSECIIDSKVVMLKPGWFPAIPGWHLDAAPRGDTGQPALRPDMLTSEHIAVSLGLNVPTIYADGPVVLPAVPPNRVEDGPIYRTWDKLLSANPPALKEIPSGVVVRFDGQTLHKCGVSTGSGWRMFIRASRTGRKPVDEMRTQVQVYLDGLDKAGW